MTSTVEHCGPAGITSKLAIILGLILGVTVKQIQRSSVAVAMAAEGAAAGGEEIMRGCWMSPFPAPGSRWVCQAPCATQVLRPHSPSARCCGKVSSNRNASCVNGELDRLGMRAELRSWRLIVEEVRDQGAPAQGYAGGGVEIGAL